MNHLSDDLLNKYIDEEAEVFATEKAELKKTALLIQEYFYYFYPINP